MSNTTQFIIVDPAKRLVTGARFETLQDAERFAGLNPDEVDHGSHKRGIGYVVYEFGMFVPAREQFYFGLEGRLIAGPAVFYGYDQLGETCNLTEIPEPVWFERVAQIEFAIKHGRIKRPEIRANGKLIWQWPQPAPEGMKP